MKENLSKNNKSNNHVHGYESMKESQIILSTELKRGCTMTKCGVGLGYGEELHVPLT